MSPARGKPGEPPQPPQIRDEPRGAARGFIVTSLLVAVGLIMLVGAANAIVDPYATFGANIVAPTVWTDRQAKVDLVDKLDQAPDVVIVGSSRAMKLEPSYLKSKTGLTAFNFAVSDGRAPDVYTILRLMHERFPEHQASYLWLFDLETLSRAPIDARLLSTEELATYLPAVARAKGFAEDVATILSWRTLAESWRSVRHATEDSGKLTPDQALEPRKTPIPEFAADGFRTWDFHDRQAARGRTLERNLPDTIRQYSAIYSSRFNGFDPVAKQYLERALGQLNDWGVEPVLALSPVQPELQAALGPLGYEDRRREALAYFGQLQKRYDFVLLDTTEIDSFDGTADDFFDGVHMTVPNGRRLLDQVVAGSEGALGSAQR